MLPLDTSKRGVGAPVSFIITKATFFSITFFILCVSVSSVQIPYSYDHLLGYSKLQGRVYSDEEVRKHIEEGLIDADSGPFDGIEEFE